MSGELGTRTLWSGGQTLFNVIKKREKTCLVVFWSSIFNIKKFGLLIWKFR